PFMSTLRSLIRFFSPVPKAYTIDTPILDNSGTSGATHVRIIAGINADDSTTWRLSSLNLDLRSISVDGRIVQQFGALHSGNASFMVRYRGEKR
ncbi:MAG: hypothetical protein ACFNM6_03730, partial [Prevotella sp.]